MIKKIILGVLAILVIIQFIPVDLNQEEVVPSTDFIKTENPPLEIANLFKTSCYDCHSNNTTYPWFDKIAPVSFWVNHHIEEAKEELNFSEWATYSEKRKKHKLDEILEEVLEKEMPLDSYLWTHGEAELSSEQIEQLEAWIVTIK